MIKVTRVQQNSFLTKVEEKRRLDYYYGVVWKKYDGFKVTRQTSINYYYTHYY